MQRFKHPFSTQPSRTFERCGQTVQRGKRSSGFMDQLGRRQVAFNATSRDHWDAFAEHRQCLTAVLARPTTAERSRLCILGAGNTNDLDLTALLSTHREVHLVDIDSESQILATLRADSSLGPLVASVAQFRPWRWRLHDETYLVGAVAFRLARVIRAARGCRFHTGSDAMPPYRR